MKTLTLAEVEQALIARKRALLQAIEDHANFPCQLHPQVTAFALQTDKILFASFSSEKEDSCLLQ
jgi:hypothetical protein